MNRCASICLLVGILLVLASPLAVAQSRPTSNEEQRRQQAREYEAEAAKLPQVKVDSIRQAVHFTLNDGALGATTTIRRMGNEIRVRVPDVKGIFEMTWYGAPTGDAAVDSARFQLLQQDLTDPAVGQINTMISNAAGRFLLTRDAESDLTLWSVQYIQDPPTPAGAVPQQELPVRLFITRQSEELNAKSVNLKLTAPSFTQLRIDHELAVDQYLRPIFRDYKQEASIFGIPNEIAWQVLGGNRVPDAQTIEKVKAIIARLDADDFRDRQKALADLKEMGQSASVAISRIDRSKLTLEQNTAIDAFLAEAAPLASAESTAKAQSKSFLLDVLFSDDAALRQAALDQLSKLAGKQITLDPKLDPDARAAAVVQLRNQLVPAEGMTLP